MSEDHVERILAWARRYAARAGFKLNPDIAHARLVAQGLAQNLKRYGKRYCPCRVITGQIQQDRKIICPCAYHREEIASYGSCLCGLFLKSSE